MRRTVLALLLAAAAHADTFTGRLLTPDAKPASRASVSLVEIPPGPTLAVPGKQPETRVLASALTDESGRFTIDASALERGWPAIRVEGPGIASITCSSWRVATGVAAMPHDVDLPFALPPCAVEGMVLDPEGKPAPGVKLGIVTGRDELGMSMSAATSDADGRFTLPGAPRGGRLAVIARRDDGAIGRFAGSIDDVANLRVVVMLERASEISGRLVRLTSDGFAPIAGARIVLPAKATRWGSSWLATGDFDGTILAETTTDADGRYRLMASQSRPTIAAPGLAVTELKGGTQPISAVAASRGVVLDVDGRPIAGAVVHRSNDSAVAVVTDASGGFLMPRARTDDTLAVDAPGVLGTRSVPPASQSVRVAIGHGRVSGLVRMPDADDGSPGAPAANALVILRNGSLQLLTTTDEAGRYAVDGVPPGLVQLSAQSAGLIGTTRGRGGTIRLATPAKLRLRVVETAGGAPVAGAVVLATPATTASLPRWARAGGDGIVSIDGITKGDWRLTAVERSRLAGFTTAATTSDSAEPPALKLPAAGSLAVSVTDAAGAPVPWALVAVGKAGNMQGTSGFDPYAAPRQLALATGPDGRVVVDGLPATPCLAPLALRNGFASRTGECATITAGERTEAKVVLAPAAALVVKVLDPTGAPAAAATVTARTDDATGRPWDSRSRTPPDIPSVIADSAGIARLDGLTAGPLLVRGGLRNFLPSPNTHVDVVAGETTSVELTLAPAGDVHGRVVDAGGAPAAGATVRMDWNRLADYQIAPEVTMSEDGRFVLPGLIPDLAITLTASRGADVSPPKRAMPGGDEVVLKLVARGTIEGSVTRDGEGVAGASVQCSGDAGSSSASAGDDGRFRVQGLASGTYACSCNAQGFGAGRAEGISVEAGATATTSITLSDPRTIAVTAHDADTGAPIARLSVRAGSSNVATDADGKASIEIDPWSTDAVAYLSHDDYGWSQRPIPPAPATDLDVRLSKRITVKGHVFAASGEPAAGGSVNSRPIEADGSFTLPVNGTGPLRIYASRLQDKKREELSRTVDVPPEGLPDLTLTLKPGEAGSLRVHVVDGETPVPDAPVRVIPVSAGQDATNWAQSNMWMNVEDARSAPANGTTDAQGTFLAELLAPGDYAVLASRKAEPYLGRVATGHVASGETGDVTAPLSDGRHVHGRVTRGGEPVEGASINAQAGTMNMMRQQAARTEADGTFDAGPFPASMRTLRLVVNPPEPVLPDDLREVQVSVDLAADPREVSVDLTGVSLGGTVTAGGEPVADALVETRKVSDPPETWPRVASARTHADGTFIVRGLEPGATVDVTASQPPREAAAQRVVLPAAGSAQVSLSLGEGDGISGVATTPGGPLAGSLTIVLEREDGAHLRPPPVSVERDGSFHVAVPSGTYRYRATAAGFAPLRGTIADETPLVLAFTPGASLEILVTGPDGSPAEGARATITSWNGDAVDEFLVTSLLGSGWGAGSDASGRIVAGGLGSGEHRFHVVQGDLSGDATATLVDGRKASLAVRLAPAP